MSINLKNINECFELLKYRMKINNYKCHNKKQTDNLQKEIKKVTSKIEDYKKLFNKKEYEHYCDLYYLELCNRNCDVDAPEHTQFATFN
jgi:hypothetical protein